MSCSSNPARIKHNPHPASNTLWVQISGKLTPHHTITPVAPANLTPIHSELTAILSTTFGRFGDVSNAFSKVELGVFLGVTAFDFDEGGDAT
jgi:hypothetical protein